MTRISFLPLYLALSACNGMLDGGTSRSSSGADPLVLSSPLRLDQANVAIGESEMGHAIYENSTNGNLVINHIVLAMRRPGATHAGGPYDDASPQLSAMTLTPGQMVALDASRAFNSADAVGTWEAYTTYQDAGGVWHDGPSVFFVVGVSAVHDAGCGTSGSSDGGVGGGGDGGASADSGGGVTPAHVGNPFDGANAYVNPSWSANVKATAQQTSDPTLAARLTTISNYSTAVWLDAIARIAPTDGTMSLAQHLDAALSQRQGSNPIQATFVIYDLPGRDCAALASNGELPATANGLSMYEHSYIDPIAAILGQAKYSEIRIVAIVEPDSLPNIVTNSSIGACSAAGPLYEQGVTYALDKLHAIPNVYTYLDSAHSGWLGWTSNSGAAAQEFAKVARATSAGFASIDGFITNTANYTPIVEPYMTAMQMVGGQPVQSAKFYQYNPDLDEADFAADMYTKLTAAGFPPGIGMVIDTSRNGWGGSKRPAGPSASSNVDTFVAESKIDQRAHRGLWCNVSGAGLGMPPQASPAGHAASHLAAFIWVKPPGESDGTSAATVNSQGKKADPMCDPTFTTTYGVPTGALPNSPLAGQWFPAQLIQLVQNAMPIPN